MLTKQEARDHIRETCGNGWLTLVDIAFDNKPTHIVITEVFQKWATLEIRYEGEDEDFEWLCSSIKLLSGKMCEQCGQSGRECVMDGWETTLCDVHYESSEAKEKYREE